MFLLSHLAIGLVIGIILYRFFRDPVLIAACAIGSILPDLIDKPLGDFVFISGIGGRTYIHSLVFFLLVLVIGITIWLYFRSFSGVALALGIFSHQLLDLMWKNPINWYYPFLGPYIPDQYYTTYFSKDLMAELMNPSEWLMAVAIVLILIQMFRSFGLLRYERFFTGITLILISILTVCGIVVLYCGVAGHFCLLTGWKDPLNNIVAGMVIICLAVVIVIISTKKNLMTN